MSSIVKIISTAIKEGRRKIQSLRLGREDGKNSYEAAPFGIDSNPNKNMKALYIETGIKGKSVIVGYINTDQLAEVGSLRLYSNNANIYLRENGTIELNGTSDFMVRYSALETAFNELNTKFNTHSHAANGTPTATPSTADITGAKIENIKTN